MSANARKGSVTVDSASIFNNYDLPILLGIGGTVATSGPADVTFDAAYMRSLFKVNDKLDGSVYNTGFMFLAGVIF